MRHARRIYGFVALTALVLVPLAPLSQAAATSLPRVSTMGFSALTGTCRLVSVPTASPIGTGSCSGVRPGAFFESPTAGCSFNFLFKGSDGYRYMGSAGHCLVGDGREAKWGPGQGPVIKAGGRVVGRGAYAILKGNRDFSLIRLDRNVKASAQMCHFGGPTGIDTARMSGPVILEQYGNGVAVSALTPARTYVAMNTRDPDVVTAIGAAAFGDSGSGATRSGKAVGVLVSIGLNTSTIGNVFITRLPPQLARAQSVLGISLQLQTAPRL